MRSLIKFFLPLSLAACTSVGPVERAPFGASVRELLAAQVRQPQGAPAKPEQLDGRSARLILERYERTQANPPHAGNSLTIGVGK